MTLEFMHWPKIPRVANVQCYITEKIDGTNALIAIGPDSSGAPEFRVGSRNRWITPEQDNYGFARWAYEHRELLLRLGEGYHYGEWWGQGIQRGYGLSERRFSLFDTRRWGGPGHNELAARGLGELVSVVPMIGGCSLDNLSATMTFLWEYLQANGSVAAPGFMRPEGFVVQVGDMRFKVTDAGQKVRNANEIPVPSGQLRPGGAEECAPIAGHPAV
jgi:RNA ligase-like protein